MPAEGMAEEAVDFLSLLSEANRERVLGGLETDEVSLVTLDADLAPSVSGIVATASIDALQVRRSLGGGNQRVATGR